MRHNVDGQGASDFVPASTNAFVKHVTNRNESALGRDPQLGDGTFTMSESCNSGDVMLSGGPANISPTTGMVESFPPATSSWPARVDKNGLGNSYNVVVLCATTDDRLLLFEQGTYGMVRSLFFRPGSSSRS
jgi:hypothetical protein